jgi:hypothetical protein
VHWSSDKDSISGALAWYKAKLHSVDVYHYAYESVQNTLHTNKQKSTSSLEPMLAKITLRGMGFKFVQMNRNTLLQVEVIAKE